MNLIIDQGNTVVKIAVFSDGKIIERFIGEEINVDSLKKQLKKYKQINRGILSSVVEVNEELIQSLKSFMKVFIVLDANTPIPIKNKYSTKDTLGYDRIANATGAHTIFPGEDVLVIDAGTALTFDLVNSAGEFLGGNISPGMNLRFKALNQFTSRLPMVEKSDVYPFLAAKTSDAVLSGVINSVIFEMDGYIEKLRSLYPGLKTVLTGGDADFFAKKLKNIIFVDSNITLTGLNKVLEYNAK